MAGRWASRRAPSGRPSPYLGSLGGSSRGGIARALQVWPPHIQSCVRRHGPIGPGQHPATRAGEFRNLSDRAIGGPGHCAHSDTYPAPMACHSPDGHAIIAMGPLGWRAAARFPANRRSTAADRRCSAATTGSPAAQRRPRSARAGYTTSSMVCTNGSAANARSSSASMRGESPWRADALIREMSESIGRVSVPTSRVDSAVRPDTASEMRCPSATRAASHSTRSISSAPYLRWPPLVRHGRSTP